MLGPVRHQCPDEGDKGRHHPLAGGVLRIAAAEEVDSLQVRHPRPFVDVVDLTADERLKGNRVHLPIIEQGRPVMRRALRFAHHPAGCRNGRRIQGVRPRLRGLKQGAARGGANDGPSGARFEHVAFGVRDQRQASGHQQASPELPVRGGECGRIAMQKEQLHRTRAQQTLIECCRLALGRVEAFESQSGVDGVKRLVVLAGAFFFVADEPILALPAGTRQMPDALLEHGLLGLPAPGELQDATRAGRSVIGLFESGDQRRGVDVAGGQPVAERPAVRQELGLPDDPVPAVGQVAPLQVRIEMDVLLDMGNEGSIGLVVEADAARQPLALGRVVLALVVDIQGSIGRIPQETGQPRSRRRTEKSHVLDPPRNAQVIGSTQQAVEKRLKCAVDQRGVADVPLLTAVGPQGLGDFEIDQIGLDRRVALNLPDVSAVGTVAVRIAQHRLEAFVEFVS